MYSGLRYELTQRLRLALMLASAVLILHDTPWLSNEWCLKDFQVDTSTSSIDHVFLPLITPSDDQNPPLRKRRRLVKNGTVFSLGVALLELSHQNPLAAFQQPEDLNEEGQADAMTEVSVATRLATRLSYVESKTMQK